MFSSCRYSEHEVLAVVAVILDPAPEVLKNCGQGLRADIARRRVVVLFGKCLVVGRLAWVNDHPAAWTTHWRVSFDPGAGRRNLGEDPGKAFHADTMTARKENDVVVDGVVADWIFKLASVLFFIVL